MKSKYANIRNQSFLTYNIYSSRTYIMRHYSVLNCLIFRTLLSRLNAHEQRLKRPEVTLLLLLSTRLTYRSGLLYLLEFIVANIILYCYMSMVLSPLLVLQNLYMLSLFILNCTNYFPYCTNLNYLVTMMYKETTVFPL